MLQKSLKYLIVWSWLVWGLVSGSQAQVAFWQRYLGGSHFDKGKAVMLRADGTIVAAGETRSSDGLGRGNHGELTSDVVVLQYATQGRFFWRQVIGGSGEESFSQMIQTQDNGFCFIGSSTSADGDLSANQGGQDVWVVKLSPAGKVQWSRSFGGSGDDVGTALIQTADGGFYLGGESASRDGDMESVHHGGLDSWIARLDAQGNLLWEKHFGGTGNEKVTGLHLLPNEDLLVVNSTDSNNGDILYHIGKKDVWVFALDREGTLRWQACYGGSDNDDVHSSLLDPQGNLVLVGTTFSGDGHVPMQRGLGDLWAFRLTQEGTLLWSMTYGGPRSDGANHVALTHDSSYVICGVTRSRTGEGDIEYNQGYYDGWLLKLDPDGNRRWSRTLGFEGKDRLESICEIPAGGFLTLGYSQLERGAPPVPGHNGMADFWLINLGDPGRAGVRPYVTPPILTGTVVDKETRAFLNAGITLTDNQTLDSLSSTRTEPESGQFVLLLPSYGLASINVLAEGYLFYGRDIRMDTVIDRTAIEQTIELEPIRIGSSLILENIYFEVGKWDLLPPSYAELERMEAFMKLNPRVEIQVSGHTDNTGNKAQKVALSLKRANAVREYLIQQGIDEKRMRVKGYGMYRPIADNRTAEGRRRNRRVEFEVIAK